MAKTSPASTVPSELPATPPVPEETKPPELVAPATALPSDKYESPATPPEPEKPAIPAASDGLIAAIDQVIAHLLIDPTRWRLPVPAPLDAWMPLQYVLIDGGTDAKLQKARDVVGSEETLFRIYAGPTERERLLVVRVTGTTYARMEVLPWTMGK